MSSVAVDCALESIKLINQNRWKGEWRPLDRQAAFYHEAIDVLAEARVAPMTRMEQLSGRQLECDNFNANRFIVFKLVFDPPRFTARIFLFSLLFISLCAILLMACFYAAMLNRVLSESFDRL